MEVHQDSLFSSISQSLLRFMSTESVMLSNHLILCCTFLLLPSIFPIIQFSSVTLSYPTLPSSQWCHPTISSLSSPSPAAFNLAKNQGLFYESVPHIRWPKYWSIQHQSFQWVFRLISFRIDGWISLQSKGLSRIFFNTTVQKHQFFSTQLSL